MSTGYESEISDITYLLKVASDLHREQFEKLMNIRIKSEKGGNRFFDQSGTEISLSEVHQRSQSNVEIQRSVYNLWMSYAR